MPPITPDPAAIIDVTGGAHTHQDTRTAAVIDLVGRVLGTQQFPATAAGYTALLAWMRGFGRLLRPGSRAPAPTAKDSPASYATKASR